MSENFLRTGAVLILLASSVGCAGTDRPTAIFPSKVVEASNNWSISFWQDYVKSLDNKPLWTEAAAKGYQTRIRLTVGGSRRLRVSLRIDERESGQLIGRAAFARETRNGRPKRVDVQKFYVSRTQWAKLKASFEKAKLWSIYPEFYENQGCVGGNEILFERFDEDGYRFSQSNYPCGTSQPVMEAAGLFVRVADQKESLKLIGLEE